MERIVWVNDKLMQAGDCRAPSDLTDNTAKFAYGQFTDYSPLENCAQRACVPVGIAKALDLGYIAKGYCSERDLVEMDALCPSPLSLFKVF